jgi:Flp pilus assembly protein TadB
MGGRTETAFRGALTSQLGHPIAQLRTHPSERFRLLGAAMGETWHRRQRGGIMDNVERSFAAATAAGFVVLVIGIVLLALM